MNPALPTTRHEERKSGVKYLIVTADDLGLTKSINEGIAKAYREGIVRSVSVIPTGEALEDGIKVIKDLKIEDVGAHLALTETRPLLDSSKFYKNHSQFFLKLFLGGINLEDLYKELKAQIDLLKKSGVRITHLNSHEHIHMMPALMKIFVKLAKEYNIPAIRYPRGDRPPKRSAINEIYKSFILSYLSRSTEEILKNSDLLYTDFFLGLLDAGHIDEDKLLGMVAGLKDGVTELVTHPGFLSPEVLDRYPWHTGAETELFALTGSRIKNAIKTNDIRLIKYQEFLSLKK
jgi:chitin disaccharide deacetylase